MFGISHPNTEFSTIRSQVGEQLEQRGLPACENPVPLPHFDTRGVLIDHSYGPCRKCSACMKRRQYDIAVKSAAEYWRAEKTWFITLTHTSVPWYDKVTKEWKNPKALDETFCHVTEEPDYSDVQKYLKRIRKKSDLRYIITEEEGSEHGRTHWHMLIFGNSSITARQLKRQWYYGNVNCKLATDPHCGHYIAKYIAKGGRLRMSQSFGATNYLFDEKGSRYSLDADHYERTGEKTGILAVIPDGASYLGKRGTELNATGVQCVRAEEAKQRVCCLDNAGDIPW
jgi:hypothetical protein